LNAAPSTLIINTTTSAAAQPHQVPFRGIDHHRTEEASSTSRGRCGRDCRPGASRRRAITRSASPARCQDDDRRSGIRVGVHRINAARSRVALAGIRPGGGLISPVKRTSDLAGPLRGTAIPLHEGFQMNAGRMGCPEFLPYASLRSPPSLVLCCLESTGQNPVVCTSAVGMTAAGILRGKGGASL
jgi:hypothetical protein